MRINQRVTTEVGISNYLRSRRSRLLTSKESEIHWLDCNDIPDRAPVVSTALYSKEAVSRLNLNRRISAAA